MCNFKHYDSASKVQKIPKEGVGWKIFDTFGGGLLSMVLWQSYRKTDQEIIWDNDLFGDGFCFFRSKREANRCLQAWIPETDTGRSYTIKKIAYSGGLQSHLENRLISRSGSFRISLCKSFRIL